MSNKIKKLTEIYQWLTNELPTYHEIKQKYNTTLAEAQELGAIHNQATGPGGKGFRWFCKKYKRLFK
jgi:hypothetical protein